MQGEALDKTMRRARQHAAVLWLAGLGLLAVGAYQLLGNPGLLVAFGFFGITQGVAQEIRSAIYPVGLVAIESLAATKVGAHE
jgi:hypothetical protein